MAVYKEEKTKHMAGNLPLHRLDGRKEADTEAWFQDQTRSTGMGTRTASQGKCRPRYDVCKFL